MMKKSNAFTAVLAFAFILVTLVSQSSTAWGWGAGMHASLTAQAHDDMTKRWKSALDRGLMMYGSWGPDVWYILSDDFMELLCPIACGADNGRVSNECWGRYNDPDRYFNYTRHLLANAESMEALSWVFGYGAHAVEDWRGHMEYIIPDWVNPEGQLFNRHTLIDSSGAALAFNVDGLYGYPSGFGMDKIGYGYRDGGLLTAENAEEISGEREPWLGMSVHIVDGVNGRQVKWKGILNEEITHLAGESISVMTDRASLGSASEGILANQYGMDQYDSIGTRFPIVVEDGSVAIECGTNFRQRMEAEEGYGYPIACQIGFAAVSGLTQWPHYLKPAAEEGEDIIVDKERVALWMDKIANYYESAGNRLDDKAVFGINEDTGLSEKHLYGVDDRDFTFGRSMPEIVSEVLTLSVQDIVERLYENGHVIGTALQSRVNPVDKARFVDMDFHYRPRMSAWPGSLQFEEQSISLLPQSPGPFAVMQLAFDVSPNASNHGNELVFPYYLAHLNFKRDEMSGTGALRVSLAYRDEMNEVIGDERSFTVDLDNLTLGEDVSGLAHLEQEGDSHTLTVLMDNEEGGWHYYLEGGPRVALTLQVELLITDSDYPPYELLLDIVAQGYCDKPSVFEPPDASTDNSECPLYVPDFPEPEFETEADGDEEVELEFEMQDAETESPSPGSDGDIEPEEEDLPSDGDDDQILAPETSDGGGCSQTNQSGMLLLLLLTLMIVRQSKRLGR